MKKTSNALRITIFVVLLLAVALSAALTVNERNAYAETNTYKLSFLCPDGYFTKETGCKIKFLVPEELYNSYSLKITYQRVKLNAPEYENVDDYVSDGEVTSENFEVLDEKGTVAVGSKSDITVSGSTYYFELTTKENCAYIFTVERQGSRTEEAKTEYQTIYFRKIDYAAPTFTVVSSVWRATGMNVSFLVFDNKTAGSATSGIKTVSIYENGEEDPAFTKDYGTGVSKTDLLSFVSEFNKEYYVVMTDYAGNKTEKLKFPSFASDVYDATAEASAENAISDLSNGKYTDGITYAVNEAFYKYMAVTRDTAKTEQEKQAALAELNAAITLYNSAKNLYNNGNGSKVTVKTEIVNGESAPELTLVGAEAGLSFLKIGDEVTITLSAAHYAKGEITKDAELIKQADDEMKSADEAYVVQIKTVSSEEGEIRREFAAVPEIRLNLGESEKVAAVQTVYSTTGGKTYYRCIVVKHVDGTVSVSVPYTGGTVTVFVERENNNLYWLFALTAIPLLIGAALLIYAFRKMNKVKAEALRKREEESAKEGAEKKTAVPENKKKKKKKKR